MSHPLPPKKEVALALLERSRVHIHLDPRKDGVTVPVGFRKQPQLVLEIGLNMPVPIPDLRLDDVGMSCTLSFSRTPFYCVVPWSSVFAMVGEDGRGMVWPDDVPPEIATQAGARAPRSSRRPAPPPGQAAKRALEPVRADRGDAARRREAEGEAPVAREEAADRRGRAHDPRAPGARRAPASSRTARPPPGAEREEAPGPASAARRVGLRQGEARASAVPARRQVAVRFRSAWSPDRGARLGSGVRSGGVRRGRHGGRGERGLPRGAGLHPRRTRRDGGAGRERRCLVGDDAADATSADAGDAGGPDATSDASDVDGDAAPA